MITITVLLILLNVIYGSAIVWCVRSIRKTNPARINKRKAKVVRMKIELLRQELDEKLGLSLKEMQGS